MLLRNGVAESVIPSRIRGAGSINDRSAWTRSSEIRSMHFTTAWTEKLPETATSQWYLIPMKAAGPPPPSGALLTRMILGVGL
jgi:hypothetical protein